MMKIEVDTRELAKLARELEDARPVIRSELGKAMAVSLEEVRNAALDETPVGATGDLSGGIDTRIFGIPEGLGGEVVTSALYGEAVELGTAPHFPPIAPLEYWADRVLGKAGLGFVIARAISKRGTKPRRMFSRALTATKTQIEYNFDAAVGRILRRFGR